MRSNPYSYTPTFEPLLHQAGASIPALRRIAKNPWAKVILGNPEDTDKANKLNEMAMRNQPMSKEDQDWQRQRFVGSAPMIAGMAGGARANKAYDAWYKASKEAINKIPVSKLMSSPTMNFGRGGTMNPEQAKKYAVESAKRLQEYLQGKR